MSEKYCSTSTTADSVRVSEVSLMDGYFYVEHAQRRVPLHGTTIEEAVTDMLSIWLSHSRILNLLQWWQLNFCLDDQSVVK